MRNTPDLELRVLAVHNHEALEDGEIEAATRKDAGNVLQLRQCIPFPN